MAVIARILFIVLGVISAAAGFCYTMSLAMPSWTYWVATDKCMKKDGCSGSTSKGEAFPPEYQKQSHIGLFVMNQAGPNEAGLEKLKTKPYSRVRSQEENLCKTFFSSIVWVDADGDKCSWDDDTLICTCPFPGRESFVTFVELTQKGSNIDCYTKAYKDRYDDVGYDSIGEAGHAYYNSFMSARTAIIVATCCHFISLFVCCAGAVLLIWHLGLVVLVLEMIAFICGSIGLANGIRGSGLAYTWPTCGSFKAWMEDSKNIPSEDDVSSFGRAGLACVFGLVGSLICLLLALAVSYLAKSAQPTVKLVADTPSHHASLLPPTPEGGETAEGEL